jgi:hypothetical protein
VGGGVLGASLYVLLCGSLVGLPSVCFCGVRADDRARSLPSDCSSSHCSWESRRKGLAGRATRFAFWSLTALLPELWR